MKNKLKIYGFILIGIAFLLIIIGIILAGISGNKKSNGFVVKNNYQQYSIDQQIALILASDYIKGQAVIENLEEAKYSDNEFNFRYIIKKGDTDYTNDEIYVRTEDFVSYNLTSTIYENDTPNSNSISGYDIFLYTTKEMVYELAKGNNYYVGKTLTGEQMKVILDILEKTDVGTYIKKIESNGYRLTKYNASPEDKIIFTYEDNDDNYLEIYNAINDIKRWVVYGADNKQLSDSYQYVDFMNKFVIDKTISLDSASYNKLKVQIGTFFDT